MDTKQAYESPVVETYELVPVGKILMFSGENKNEKFVIDEQNQYNDSDFV
jgi:hypothetical protein